MRDGFVRVASATPAIRVADCRHNADAILTLAREASEAGVRLMVTPELCLTGYTCGDLFLQQTLLDRAREELLRIAQEASALDIVLLVGLPVAVQERICNCAAVLYHGRILGIVPKTHIPNYAEFYEKRHFSPGNGPAVLSIGGQEVPFGTDLLFECATLPHFVLGVEICEDLWVPVPPSCVAALAGATLIANLSASDETIAKANYRHTLLRSQSARLICAYVYADAGEGESTTDLVFSGHDLVYENGRLLAESERFGTGWIQADVDLAMLQAERRRQDTFVGPDAQSATPYRRVLFDMPVSALDLARLYPPHPFVPADPAELAERCEEILNIQSAGLAKRLAHARSTSAVGGLSGGLDSTLALMVIVRAFDRLGLDRAGITAVTMPGFGTTDRTYTNAVTLTRCVGAALREIPISEAVLGHFRDIGHDPAVHNTTYENAQARERTQILMDIANQIGGLVVGTGDLSELSLGWATYNGDHMSMYGVNASIPKTLVRHLVKYAASVSPDELRIVLEDIGDTPVSPELLPPDEAGKIAQKTEEIVGPYELHDFFLYYMVRFGFPPAKILRIARIAFADKYDAAAIRRVLELFYRRFFSQQFKRSCLPDGPKVGSVTLSPRGDWRMPSDAVAQIWLDDLENAKLE
ncbi:MAG: NAD(+) synthase [Clostridiaceae bacterium]|nr:NAD(+) synthase [Clostridiaceae bacterium]